jgi:hypothetical protein
MTQWTVVYDTITRLYIYRVPIYEGGASCKKRTTPLKHLWVLNTVHKKVCIRCGLISQISSFYKFAIEVGLLNRSEIQRIRRRLRAGH